MVHLIPTVFRRTAGHYSRALVTREGLLFVISSIILCGGAVGVFFREFFGSHFNLIAGNTDDNRLYIAILEHWRAVANGKAGFTSPNFFWPEQHVLGYSDAFFLPVLPYSLLRSMGFDLYVSFEITLLVLKAIGFFGTLWLLRSFVGLGKPAALVGATLFTLSNMYYVQLGHVQLMTIVFIPVFVSLILSSWREQSLGRIVQADIYISLAASLLALVLFTSFYIGWFTIFAGGGILITALTGRIIAVRNFGPVAEWVLAAWARRGMLALGLGVFALSLIPFAITYLPALRQSGGRPFSEVLQNSPEPVDVINVGFYNWMWGSTFSSTFLRLNERTASGEKIFGWPPLILLVFVGATLASCILLLRPRTLGAPARSLQVSRVAVLGVTAVTLWLTSVKIGTFSLWWLVYRVIPGATAMRAPGRLSLVINLLVVIVAAMVIDELATRIGRGGQVAIVLCGLIFAGEQLNLVPSHEIRRDEENAVMLRVKPVPNYCKSFFVTNPVTTNRSYPSRAPTAWSGTQQVDAMLVARALNIPTLNGYSGLEPPEWSFLVHDDKYLSQARNWAKVKKIEDGLCGCDLTTGAWSSIDPLPAVLYTAGTVVDFRTGGHAGEFESQGWGDAEPGGTWTLGGNSVLIFNLVAMPTTDLWLDFEAHAFTSPQRPQFTDTLLVNNTKVAEWQITDKEALVKRHVRIPQTLISSRSVRVEFVNHDPRSPAEVGATPDPRKLGLAIHTLSLRPEIRYMAGTIVDFRTGGHAEEFKTQGWGDAEPGGTWTLGGQSVLIFNLVAMPTTDLWLDFEAHAFTAPQRPQFTDTLLVNNKKVAEWEITNEETLIKRHVRIPHTLISSPSVQVEFVNHDPRSPADVGATPDPRKLGLAIHTLSLQTTDK